MPAARRPSARCSPNQRTLIGTLHTDQVSQSQALQRQDKGKAIDTSTTPTTTRLGGQDRGLFITMHVAHKQGRKEQRAFNRKQSQHIHPSTSGVHAAIQQEAAVNRQPRRTRIPNSSHSTKRGT
jgi:hypothetical protein